MSDTEKFNWRNKKHRKAFLWRLYYNIGMKLSKKYRKKYDLLPLWDDYLSEEYYERVDKELKK